MPRTRRYILNTLTALILPLILQGCSDDSRSIYSWESEQLSTENEIHARSTTTDDDVASLRNSKLITWISLSSTQITDVSLDHLSTINGLEVLKLSNTAITDAGLKKLMALPKLDYLFLGDTRITDDGLSHLAQIPTLTYLEIHQTDVTDEGIVHLVRLANLGTLSIGSEKITDDCLGHIAKLPRLKELTIRGSQFTAKGLTELGGANALERLSLYGPMDMTDAMSDALLNITRLKFLYLFDVKATDEQLELLRKKIGENNVFVRLRQDEK